MLDPEAAGRSRQLFPAAVAFSRMEDASRPLTRAGRAAGPDVPVTSPLASCRNGPGVFPGWPSDVRKVFAIRAKAGQTSMGTPETASAARAPLGGCGVVGQPNEGCHRTEVSPGATADGKEEAGLRRCVARCGQRHPRIRRATDGAARERLDKLSPLEAGGTLPPVQLPRTVIALGCGRPSVRWLSRRWAVRSAAPSLRRSALPKFVTLRHRGTRACRGSPKLHVHKRSFRRTTAAVFLHSEVVWRKLGQRRQEQNKGTGLGLPTGSHHHRSAGSRWSGRGLSPLGSSFLHASASCFACVDGVIVGVGWRPWRFVLPPESVVRPVDS